MNYLEFAGPLSQLLFIVAFAWYIARIAKGGVRVGVSTFTVLALTSISQAVALYVEQSWYPAVFMLLTSVVNSVIIVLGLRKKNYQFKATDWLVIGAAIIGILVWALLHSAAWNVYILTAAILITYIPLFTKTYRSPSSEAKGPWVATLIASLVFLLTIFSFNPIDWVVQVRQLVFAVGMMLALTLSKAK